MTLMAILLRSGHLARNFYILYGMLDHCSIYLAQAARSHLFHDSRRGLHRLPTAP